MDTLRAMRVFVEVVDQGSLVGAARSLDLAPAVVTRLVAELEAHLGVRLLNRTTRRLSLTEAGVNYLERCRDVDHRVAQAEDEARALVREPIGHLRVMSPPAFAAHQLAPVLPAFHAAFPKVTLELHAEIDVIAAIDAVDVTLVVSGEPLRGEFVARRLAASELVVCASPQYLARRGKPTHPRDLPAHSAMLPRGYDRAAAGGLEFVRRDGKERFVVLPQGRPLLTTGHLQVQHAAALEGLGLAGLPSFVAAQALADGRLQHVLPQWRLFTLDVWAAMPSRQHLPLATRAFVDHLVASFGGADHDPWLPQAPLAATTKVARPRPPKRRALVG